MAEEYSRSVAPKGRFNQVISRGRSESTPTSLSANGKAQFSKVVRSSASHSLPNQRSDLEINTISNWKPLKLTPHVVGYMRIFRQVSQKSGCCILNELKLTNAELREAQED